MALPNKEIEAAVMPVLERHDCDLVLGTFRRERSGRVLRLLIERRGSDPAEGSGVDLALCASISRDVSAVLDVEDIIDDAYTLEVSSPGIERPLVQPRDFDRFCGRTAQIKTKKPFENSRRFRGTLKGYDEGKVWIKITDQQTFGIPAEIINKANLVFDPKGYRRD